MVKSINNISTTTTAFNTTMASSHPVKTIPQLKTFESSLKLRDAYLSEELQEEARLIDREKEDDDSVIKEYVLQMTMRSIGLVQNAGWGKE